MSSDATPSSDFIEEDAPSVGRILRESREYYGYALREVATLLKIREAFLAALEEDRPKDLPGPVYAIGFVRSYAEFLGLDGGQVVALYKKQEGGVRLQKLAMSVPIIDSQSPGIRSVTISVIGVLLLLWIGSWDSYNSLKNRAIPEAPQDLVEAGKLITATQGTVPSEISGTNTSEKEAPRIEIIATQESWIQIKTIDEAILYSGVLDKGERFVIPQDRLNGATMKTGNAGGVQVVVEGRELPYFGEEGEVVRDIALDLDVLKTLQEMSASGTNSR